MIHQITLQDCLEPTAPPGKVLALGALDDTVFVRICTVEQDFQRETQTEVADISVSLPSLLEAVMVLMNDVEREHLRPVEREGQMETRLAGRRFSLPPIGPHAAVGAQSVHQRYTQMPEPSAVDRDEP